MKKIFLAATLLILVSAGAGAGYDFFLIGDDLKERFHVTVYTFPSNGNTTDFRLRYNITIHEENYNRTEIHNFTAALKDENYTIAADSGELGKLKDEGSKLGFRDMESQQPPDRVTRLELRLNYTATTFDGKKVNGIAKNSIGYEINDIHPGIESLHTPQKEVRRGHNITLTARTSDIEKLETESSNFSEVGEDRFTGNLTIPHQIGTNESPSYTFTDSRGNIFEKTLDVKVVNTPPVLEMSFESRVKPGENTELELETEDDFKINRTYVMFRGRRYNVENEKVTLLTEKLSGGNYTFRAVAIDSDGARTTATGKLTVPGNSSKQDGPSKNNRGGTGSNPDQSIVESILSFFRSLV